MNKGLTAIEYEGLEYVLIKIVTAGADFMGAKIPSGRDIRDCLIHTSNGIRFRNESADICRVGNFILKSIYIQDGTCILTAYNQSRESDSNPAYADLTDLLGSEDFDICELLRKLYRSC